MPESLRLHRRTTVVSFYHAPDVDGRSLLQPFRGVAFETYQVLSRLETDVNNDVHASFLSGSDGILDIPTQMISRLDNF